MNKNLSRHPGSVYFKPGSRADIATSWSVPSLCAAYKWPSGLAGGGVIAIVELGGGWVQSDMDTYFASIGQPVPHITDVALDISNSPSQSVGSADDPDMEVTLDIQVAAAAYYVATGKPATIRIYWSTSIATAVRAATADGCDVCSISWGADEANWLASGQVNGVNDLQDMENAALAATTAGMVVFGASGDNDSSDGGPNAANVDAPASCPHVIGCGGTKKTQDSEVVWNSSPGLSDGHGTGGGYSSYFPLQSFEIGISGPGRMVPDVSANADPSTGYQIVVHGQKTVLGGTSAVAPLYAGLFASFGRKLGFVTPTLWKSQNFFNDIVSGNNGQYKAAIGPDACTGLGSPIGDKLAKLF